MALGALACMAALVLPASAADTENDIEDALTSFTLQGTNGFSMLVFASPEVDEPVKSGGERKGDVVVYLLRKPAAVAYIVPAKMTAEFIEGRPTITSLHASLGKVGQIDLAFKSSGGKKTARGRCGGGSIEYAAGDYEGSIEVHGEEGFTDVSATMATQRPDDLLNLICTDKEEEEIQGPRQPGAQLEADKLLLTPGVFGFQELQVNKNHPGAKTHIRAATLEEQGKVEIIRTVEMDAPAGTFVFDRRLRQARLSLPAPFSGHAVYHRKAKRANQWRGNLVVDLPGRANVRLATPGFDVSLDHATRRVLPPGVTSRIERTMRRIVR